MTIISQMFPYSETSGTVTVRVAPRYHPEHSDPALPHHVWSYHVRVENHGARPIQLLSRHWDIRDGKGRSDVVEGEGVIGQQPVIEPGQAFDYMSGCPLATPTGQMSGHYIMTGDEGRFEARIPLFKLEAKAAGRS